MLLPMPKLPDEAAPMHDEVAPMPDEVALMSDEVAHRCPDEVAPMPDEVNGNMSMKFFVFILDVIRWSNKRII